MPWASLILIECLSSVTSGNNLWKNILNLTPTSMGGGRRILLEWQVIGPALPFHYTTFTWTSGDIQWHKTNIRGLRIRPIKYNLRMYFQIRANLKKAYVYSKSLSPTSCEISYGQIVFKYNSWWGSFFLSFFLNFCYTKAFANQSCWKYPKTIPSNIICKESNTGIQ